MEKRAIVGTGAVFAFLRAFETAPPDADIEVGYVVACTERPLVTLSVNDQHFAIDPPDAIKLADILEKTVRQFPQASVTENLASIALGLREGAKRASTP